jgi:hypothetical protein
MAKNSRKLTISHSYNKREDCSVLVPFIRLKGQWLSDIGFKAGYKVRVIINDKSLTLKVEQPE